MRQKRFMSPQHKFIGPASQLVVIVMNPKLFSIRKNLSNLQVMKFQLYCHIALLTFILIIAMYPHPKVAPICIAKIWLSNAQAAMAQQLGTMLIIFLDWAAFPLIIFMLCASLVGLSS